MEYNFREIEKKWHQKWVENKTYKVVEDENKKKFYVLNMFPLSIRSWSACRSPTWLYR